MAKTMGLLLGGSLKSAGITFYQKQGQMIARTSVSAEHRSNTRGQFIQRQRMRHTTALWQMLKPCQPVFCGGKSAYARFATLANQLPVVFYPAREKGKGASFLIPGIPVSDGTLDHIDQYLGEVNGMPALITNLKAEDLDKIMTLNLYCAEQCIENGVPTLRFMNVREMSREDFTEVDGHLALTGEEFANTMRGWALVHIRHPFGADTRRCSPQTLVTRCNYYEQYTTEESMIEAARNYGGLTYNN